MKNRILYVFIVAVITGISFQSCEKEESYDNDNETKNSSYNSSESHHHGENCMSCHKPGGSGEGWFTVAGTIYDSTMTSTFPNTTVNLYSGTNGTGTIKATIEVDNYGNFYTTKNIDFGNGLYTSVTGSVSTNHMNSSVAIGQCNSCHGSITDRIWTK